MDKINLTEFPIREMSKNELKTTNGGIIGILIGICVAAFAIGYADGRSDKHEKE